MATVPIMLDVLPPHAGLRIDVDADNQLVRVQPFVMGDNNEGETPGPWSDWLDVPGAGGPPLFLCWSDLWPWDAEHPAPANLEPQPVEPCPDCDDDGDTHADGCWRVGTCGQYGPPWRAREDCHPEPTGDAWSIQWHRFHERSSHQ